MGVGWLLLLVLGSAGQGITGDWQGPTKNHREGGGLRLGGLRTDRAAAAEPRQRWSICTIPTRRCAGGHFAA